MKNSSKLIFLIMMIFSTLMIFSASSWFNAWMGLEINLMSFISFILINKKSLSIESSVIYFLIQSLASIMFLFSIIIIMLKLNINFNMYNYMNKFIMISLLIKIGSAPFHFWLPIMMEGLPWMMIYTLMTWQKLGPLMLIINSMDFKFLIIFIIMSSIFGAIGGLNQMSFKKLMSFSSIGQTSWILMSLNMSMYLIKMYLMFYFFITINIILIFYIFNLFNFHQIYNLKVKLNYKMIMFMNILSMGGLPPFLGFYPKMMILINYNMNFTILILIMTAMITLFYYIRLTYSTFLINNIKLNNFNNMNNNKIKLIMFLSFFSNMLLILILLN